MGYSKGQHEERESFLNVLCEESESGWLDIRSAGLLILRHAKTHGRLAVDACNGIGPFATGKEIDRWQERLDRKEELLERRLHEIATGIGVSLELGGDPRGFTVKLQTPKTGKYNTWGGRECGWGVPQPEGG